MAIGKSNDVFVFTRTNIDDSRHTLVCMDVVLAGVYSCPVQPYLVMNLDGSPSFSQLPHVVTDIVLPREQKQEEQP